MNKLYRIGLALMAACMVLSACAPAIDGSPAGGALDKGSKTSRELKSSLPQQTDPKSSPSDVQQLADGNTAFALSLYQQLAAADGNLFFSPYSISSALAMTYGGARGDTQSQMQATLHFPFGAEQLNPAFNRLGLDLNKQAQNADDPAKKDFELNIANAIWGQKDFKFLPAYLDMLAQNYGAGMRTVDFAADPEAARQVINAWVSQQTNDKIKDLLGQGVLTPLTRLVLTNAIYFKAAWQTPFDPKSTAPGDFFKADGSKTSIPMMHLRENLGYAKIEGVTALEIPYTGGNVSMLVLMPEPGTLESFEKSLTSEKIKSLASQVTPAQVQLSFPKFKVESSFSLKDALKAMGMQAPFDAEAADFSGMDGQKDLAIQDILHKAYVNVDEQGTEAAAATAVIVGLTTAFADTVIVDVDHPFVFVVRDLKTGTILFMGRVSDPAG